MKVRQHLLEVKTKHGIELREILEWDEEWGWRFNGSANSYSAPMKTIQKEIENDRYNFVTFDNSKDKFKFYCIGGGYTAMDLDSCVSFFRNQMRYEIIDALSGEWEEC